MSKRTAGYLLGMLACVLLAGPARGLDAPHNGASNLTCDSCHGQEIPNSPFWGGPTDDAAWDNFCLLLCHNAASGPYTDTSAPLVKGHNSANTSSQYGTWSRSCLACHDPHDHEQKGFKTSNAADLYLASGRTDLPAPVYDSASNTTVIHFSTISYKAGWDASRLVDKTLGGRHAILIPNLRKLGYNYPIVAVDEGANTITVRGDASEGFVYIPPPTDFAVIYGQFVRRYVDVAGSTVQVRFFDQSGKYSWAYDESGTGTDPTPDGICQVCHDLTSHWNQDGSGAAVGVHQGFNGSGCSFCHTHQSGFAVPQVDHTPSGNNGIRPTAKCVSCHAGADPVADLHKNTCTHCHQPSGSGISLKPGLAPGECADCHTPYSDDFAGGHQNEDHANVVATTSATPTLNCGGCHTGDIITATHNNNCNDCHTNAVSDGTLRAGALGDATGHVIGTPSACADCHSATFFPNHSHSHTVALGAADLSQESGTPCAACHNDSGGGLATWNDIFVEHKADCTTCHDAVRDTSKSGLYSIGQTIQDVIGANANPTNCSACHRDKIDSISGDATHGIDHVAQGKVTGSPQCTGCHDQAGGGDNITYINTIHKSCGTCHVVPGGAGPLHDYSASGGTIGEFINYEAVNGGAGGGCVDCHPSYGADFATGHKHEDHRNASNTADVLAGVGQCTSCHVAADAAAIVTTVHQGNCTDCHTNITTDGRLRAGSYGSAAGHTIDTGSTCADCHSAYASDFTSHQVADHSGVIANPSPATIREDCTRCHTGDLIASQASGTNPGTHQNDCLNCHTNTTTNGTLRDGAHNYGDASNHVITTPSSCNDCHAPDGYFDAHTHSHTVAIGAGDVSQEKGTACSFCHNDSGGSLASWADILTEHNASCATCHDSDRDTSKSGLYTIGQTIQDVIGANGNPTNCAACHRDKIDAIAADSRHGYPDHQVLGYVVKGGGCLDCHDNDAANPAEVVYGIHKGKCTNCHTTIPTLDDPANKANAIAISRGNCAHCHGADYTHANATHSKIAYGDPATTGDTSGCTACHDAVPVDEHIAGAITGRTWACVTCHGNPCFNTIISNAINGVTTTVYCTDCHTSQPFPHTYDHVGRGKIRMVSQCAGCHDPDGTLDPITGIHRVGSGNTCGLCHLASSGGGALINALENDAAARDGGPCTDCHNGSVGLSPPFHGTGSSGVASRHDRLSGSTGATLVAYAACTDCHSGADAQGRIDLHPTCLTCHGSSKSAVVAAIADGKGGTVITCETCHNNDSATGVMSDAATHHADPHAAAGDCTWCHADPRPDWGSTYSLTLPSPLPRQLACRECHVEASGTGLVVYKNRFTDDNGPVDQRKTGANPNAQYSYSTRLWANSQDYNLSPQGGSVVPYVSQTVIHTLTGASKIDVYNYGACLACHDGTRATRVNVWHARQKRDVEIPVDSSNNGYNMHFDVLRQHMGRNTFGLWRGSGSQGSPYFSHQEKYYDTNGDAKNRGDKMFKNRGKRNITWNDGLVSHLNKTIPCFAINDAEGQCGGGNATIPYFSDISAPSVAASDTVVVLTAGWNNDGNDELYVLAFNHADNSANLTVSYGGQVTNAPMTWNATLGGWEYTAAGVTYAGGTVTVTSSLGGSDSASVVDRTVNLALNPHEVYDNIDGGNCADCHWGNLMTEHQARGRSCAWCHGDCVSQAVADVVAAGISDPASVVCTSCHASPDPSHPAELENHTVAQQASDLAQATSSPCTDCHTTATDWAGIKTAHDTATNGPGPCNTCHLASRSEVTQAITAAADPTACLDCHSAKAAPAQHSHTLATVTILPTDQAQDPAQPCSACHGGSDAAFADFDEIFSLHANDCDMCHGSARAEVVNAINGGTTPVGCLDCHSVKATPADHTGHPKVQPGLRNSPYLGTLTCFKAGCHAGDTAAEHLTPNGIAYQKFQSYGVNFACTFCHQYWPVQAGGTFNDDPVIQAAISTGVDAGQTVFCSDCHHQASGRHDIAGLPFSVAAKYGAADYRVSSLHHASQHVRDGQCTHCHIDPRVDPYGTGVSLPQPQKLACRECHAKRDPTGGDFGTGQFTIYKHRAGSQVNPYGGDPTWSWTFTGAIANTHPSDPANGVAHQWNVDGGEIQDYGACLFCHKKRPFHAYRKDLAGPPPADANKSSRDTDPSDGVVDPPHWPGIGRGVAGVFYGIHREEAKNYQGTGQQSYKNTYRDDIRIVDGQPDNSILWAKVVYDPQSDPTNMVPTSDLCSDPTYTDQASCEAAGNWWRPGHVMNTPETFFVPTWDSPAGGDAVSISSATYNAGGRTISVTATNNTASSGTLYAIWAGRAKPMNKGSSSGGRTTWTVTFNSGDGVRDLVSFGRPGRVYVVSIDDTSQTKDVLDQAYFDVN